jgi:hypothetical protein
VAIDLGVKRFPQHYSVTREQFHEASMAATKSTSTRSDRFWLSFVVLREKCGIVLASRRGLLPPKKEQQKGCHFYQPGLLCNLEVA